ncbi:unnamed protein product [Rhizophagus irregularis]|nr:unnamed protein product [Rhizophagus irregularis]CAB5395073.1 unnamed protein product [Rhizophagus irregularis]
MNSYIPQSNNKMFQNKTIFAYSSYSSIESIWLEILRSNHKENFDASAGSKIIIFSGSMQQLLRLFSSNSSIESW